MMSITFRRGPALGALATLTVLLLAAVPVQADPVTLECISARETNAAGDRSTSFSCKAGPASGSAPGPACSACPAPSDFIFSFADQGYGAFSRAGLCAKEGPCFANEDAGYAAYKNETPTKKQYTGHVTLLK